MRAFLFRLFFGADALSTNMFQMLVTRKAAVKKHTMVKELQNQLATADQELNVHKATYADLRMQLEKAYQLNLD
jgi:hypothetical protein